MGLDGQQGLVLLRGDALLARAAFAEREEIADGAAKLAERLVVGGLERRRGRAPVDSLLRRRARGGRWRFQALIPIVTAAT
jgi:hypothetical protein